MNFLYAKKSFSLSDSFALAENLPFSQTKRLSFVENFLTVLESHLLLQTKSFSFAESFTNCPQKPPFFTFKKPFIRTNLSLFPPKITLFCPPPPLSTPLNLLFAKNTAVLLLFALNPYAVKPERRTDSNHCRRYPETCSFQHSRLPDECRSFFASKTY